MNALQSNSGEGLETHMTLGIYVPGYMLIKLGLAYSKGLNYKSLSSAVRDRDFTMCKKKHLLKRWEKVREQLMSTTWEDRGYRVLKVLFPNWPTSDIEGILRTGIAWAPPEVVQAMTPAPMLPKKPQTMFMKPDPYAQGLWTPAAQIRMPLEQSLSTAR